MHARRKWLLPALLVTVFSNILAASFPFVAQAPDGASASLSYVRLPLAFEIGRAHV